MPELPEVETVRRGLSDRIVGMTVTDVWHDWAKSFPNAATDVQEFLIDAQFTAVHRRAKVLLLELSSNYTLVCHLKMTGQIVYIKKQETDDKKRWGAGHPNDSFINDLPDKSTRVILSLQAKDKARARLFFNDQRKFGWMRLLPTAEVPKIDFMKKVGPEPLAADFTAEQFAERFTRRPNTTIKAALLDQTVVAGVGNIYADESLWGAKIHPRTLVKNVPRSKMNTLFIELRNVLELSIEKGGSSDKNYVDAGGRRGSYLTFANVFRREGQPCNRCGATIQKSRVAGRGTHTCPKCQKLSELASNK